MKKFISKTILYLILIIICLEIIVRVFHLTKDYPERYIDEYHVEKWIPNQEGHSVTGIRRQNFSSFRINNMGFNSYREFSPTNNKFELALVGDSFIEGFHQDYNNSIGVKIEHELQNIEVYEFGYAGYDFADQLHLINAYGDTFNKIDCVIIGLRFDDDLTRGKYEVLQSRIKLESGLYAKIRQVKLLVYLQNTGLLAPLWELAGRLASMGKTKGRSIKESVSQEEIKDKHLGYIENFKSLILEYGYDKQRFVLLLDGGTTPPVFLSFLNNNDYQYIDYHKALSLSKNPTTLIYDQHWNNNGRSIIAKLIADYVIKINKK